MANTSKKAEPKTSKPAAKRITTKHLTGIIAHMHALTAETVDKPSRPEMKDWVISTIQSLIDSGTDVTEPSTMTDLYVPVPAFQRLIDLRWFPKGGAYVVNSTDTVRVVINQILAYL